MTLHRVGSLQSFSTGVFVHCVQHNLAASGFGMSCIVLQSCMFALTETTGFVRGIAWMNIGTHECSGQVTSLGLDMI